MLLTRSCVFATCCLHNPLPFFTALGPFPVLPPPLPSPPQLSRSIAVASSMEDPPSPTFAFSNPHSNQPAALTAEAAAAAAASVASGDIVIRASHRGPRQLCSYSEEELQGLLSLRHSCGWGTQRYFYGGVWMNWQSLFEEFERKRGAGMGTGAEVDEPECVIACKFHADLHCSDSVPCVHAFYIRRNSTGRCLMVLSQCPTQSTKARLIISEAPSRSSYQPTALTKSVVAVVWMTVQAPQTCMQEVDAPVLAKQRCDSFQCTQGLDPRC